MASVWVDIDASIALAGKGTALTIDEAIDLHLRIIEAWIDGASVVGAD